MAAKTMFQFSNCSGAIYPLAENDLDAIQELLENCDDFSRLVSGQPAQPDEAYGLLHDLPPGKSSRDKQVYGFRDYQGKLLGVLDIVSGYPQESICFIGLFLLHPSLRGRGLGHEVMVAFADYARLAGFQEIMLGVVEENRAGLHFWQTCGFEIIEKSPPREVGQKTQYIFRMRKFLQT